MDDPFALNLNDDPLVGLLESIVEMLIECKNSENPLQKIDENISRFSILITDTRNANEEYLCQR